MNIPAEEFSGEAIDSRTDYTMNISKYLPEDIELADSNARFIR